jgi:O-acetyl-ADP-ribose deacetylase (regulator of RNase III)
LHIEAINHYIKMAAAITYIRGDATDPVGEGNKIIVHVCNDRGHWGAGFTGAIDYRWFGPSIAYQHYRMVEIDEFMQLGSIQIVKVEPTIWVVNLIGQHGTGHSVVPPIRYEAVRKGIRRVARAAVKRNASVHMPRIGCGLAGGRWSVIEPIIQEELTNEGIDVFVYDLPMV